MKLVKSLLAISAAAVLAAVPLSSAQAKSYRVIFAGYFGPDHPNSKMMEHFKNELEQVSDGQFKVTLKPNNEAGGEEKIMELCKRGTIQIAQVGGLIKNDEPMIGAWEQPFVINGWDHAREVFLYGGMKQFEGDYTANSGARIAGVIVNGFRQISSSFAVTNMEELGKMKIRTPLNEVFVQLFKALGTNPTPLPATELYTALETKVVDGQDNPYSMVKSMGWWEVNKYMLESRHIFSPTFVLVNDKWYGKLDEQAKGWFDTAMDNAIKYNWEISEKDEADTVEFFKQNGVTITVPSDEFKAQMVKAAEPAWQWFDKEVPGSKAIRDYCASVDPAKK